MKTIIEGWFSSKYFGIVLLCIIAFLALAFIVLFALAIKDAKKEKNVKSAIEETKDEKKDKKEEVAFAEKKEEPKKVEVSKKDKDAKISSKKEEKKVEEDTLESLEATLFDMDSEIALDNKIEEPQINISIEQEQNDLQSIAMSLAKGYQNDRKKKEEPIVEKMPTRSERRAENKHIKMPSLDDIPKPQPVRVVAEEPVIDTKKDKVPSKSRSLDDLVGEEYKLK